MLRTPISLQEISWMEAPSSISINCQEIHLWKCFFETELVDSAKFQRLLSNCESQRAARFVYRHDRRRYIFFHGALRTILGAYTHVQPHLLEFSQNKYGKPFILTRDNSCKLQFSLSHSKDIALIAITRDREVGVDVEYIRPMQDAREITRKYFSCVERRIMLQLEDDVFNEMFFVCWTQKEAFIKAIGRGFSFSLDQFTVPIFGSNKKVNCRESGAWRYESFTVHPGYVGALASKKGSGQLDCFKFV